MKVLKSLTRLYLAFGAVLALFLIALSTQTVHDTVVAPFTGFVATMSALVMNLFGASASVNENILSTAQYSIDVVDGCNGVYATAILISAVIAYPSGLWQKAWGIALGSAAILALNLCRVISLFYLGQHFPSVFEEVHVYVWQPVIIIWAVIIWWYWRSRIEDGR